MFGSAVGDATASTWSRTPPRAAGRRRPTSPTALERLGVVADRALGRREGRTQVGDELFAIRRLIDTNPELRNALSDQTRTPTDRTALLTGLLADQVAERPPRRWSPRRSRRGRGSVDAALDEYLDIAAEALEETVATVHTARELSDRRASSGWPPRSAGQYDTTVQLHVVLDPSLIGGLRVEIGDDVIDGTVASRLDDARRKVAG